ncbi:MAG TPA: protein-disulfide reductase DsbD [Pseudomonadales bacterium]|nr:protein-disulfide reductase DsbD [Pseudomonadales bacterium]
MTLSHRLWKTVLHLLLLISLATPGFCENPLTGKGTFNNKPEFLDVDQAFQVEVSRHQRILNIKWTVAPGYYLYRDRFSFELDPKESGASLGNVEFPGKGKMKDDPAFGLVEVFDHDIEVHVSLEGTLSESLTLVLGYQGCADAGLCYPPQTQRFPLADVPVVEKVALKNTAASTTAVPANTPKVDTPLGIQLNENHYLFGLLTLYLLGIGLAFTPCVLSMIPILSSIIAGQQQLSVRKGLVLSSAYVVAMSLTYAIAGAMVAYFGTKANLQMYLQNPWILGVFALLFVVLALSMFGFYEIQLPSFIRDRVDALNQQQKGGSLLNVALMGALSALVVSPCVSAPLISVLSFISSTGNVGLGAMALFCLGLGMGTPLILIGTGGGKFIPKAGAWMDAVKAVFGVLLLAVAIWLLERILPGPVTLALWASLLIICAIHMNALDAAPPGWPRFWKGLAVLFLMYGSILLLGAASGQSNPLRPLHFTTQENTTDAPAGQLSFQSVKNLDELQSQLASAKQQGRSVMLDFYADWCISCKIMKRGAFSDPRVQAALHNTVLLQADLSELTPAGQAMLDHFGLFGLPSILFWSPEGNEQKEARVQGEMDADQFLVHLNKNVRL